MARNQKELNGWQILVLDEKDELIDYFEQKRPRRRRGAVERRGKDQIFLKQGDEGMLLSVGDTIVVKEDIKSNGIYLIQDLRLNTPGNLIEIWAFVLLGRDEIDARSYLQEILPEFVKDNGDEDSITEKYKNLVHDKELFFTATLIEIKLEQIIDKAKVLNQTEWNLLSTTDKGYETTYFLRYACEPSSSNFVAIDIDKESKNIHEWMPKKSLEYYKRLTEPLEGRNKKSPQKREVVNLSESNGIDTVEDKSIKMSGNVVDNSDNKPQSPIKRRPGRPRKNDVNQRQPEKIVETSTANVQNHDTKVDNIDIVSSTIPQKRKRGRPKKSTTLTINSNVVESTAPTKRSTRTKKARKIYTEDSFDEDPLDSDDNSGTDYFTDADDGEYKEEEKISEKIEQDEEELEVEEDEAQISDEAELLEDDYLSDNDTAKIALNKLKKTENRPSKMVQKSYQLEDSSRRKAQSKGYSSQPYTTGSIRKFTKKNVVRAKKGYTPFSKRYKSIDDIPDLMKMADFNQESTLNYFAKLGNRLSTGNDSLEVETIFSKIKKQLTSSQNKDAIVKSGNISDHLPARENEFASIYLSVYSAIESGSATTVYIAGTPGVGKTLTVREVISDLQAASLQGELPKFQYVEINGLKMVKPTDSYEFFWNKISGEELTWAAAMESLEFYFNKVPKNKKRPIVVLLDELDALVTKSQDVMYNFFNWSTYENAKLVVISVANTMDLPEKQLGNKVSSRIGFTRIMFTGYSHEELKTIIKFRLRGLNNSSFYVDPKTGNAKLAEATSNENVPEGMLKVRLKMTDDAIEIASRKVASVSGDARRALKVCKRAAEIAEKHYMAKHGYNYDGKAIIEDEEVREELEAGNIPQIEEDNDGEVQIVNINHIMKALNETINSHAITYVSRLAFAAKLFIYAILNLMKKTNTLDQTLGNVIDEVKLLMDKNSGNKNLHDIQKALYSSDHDGNMELRIRAWDFNINQLIEAGILSRQSMRNERTTTVRVNLAVEELREAIEKDDVIKAL